jgi:hypothetical protein
VQRKGLREQILLGHPCARGNQESDREKMSMPPPRKPTPVPPRKDSNAIAAKTNGKILPRRHAYRAEDIEPSGVQRSRKDGPWAWYNKAAFNKIIDDLDDTTALIAVYSALCLIASDERSDDFRASHAKIAGKCGLSRQWTMKKLDELEFIGLIKINRSETSAKCKQPSAYTLLKCEQ